MGTSESKMAVASTTPKPDPIYRLKTQHMAQLVDPRSPSCGIDRTPIQVSSTVSEVQGVHKAVGLVCVDPRSPTVGVVRTPLKDSMKVTVSSLARRLSTFFLNDVMVGDSTSTPLPAVSFTKHPSLPAIDQQDELKSKEPLLLSHSRESISESTNCPSTPANFSSSMGYGSFCSSPFVVVGEAQLESREDIDTTIDEAEEAGLLGNSPLKRELSLSMLGCRDGVYSPEFFASAEERPSTPLPPLESQQDDRISALPCLDSKSGQSTPVPVQEAVLPQKTAETPQIPEQEDVPEEMSILPEQGLKQSEKSQPVDSENAQCEVLPPAITFPRFDTRSPSQAIFKPQWLGVGFGATGVRARGVQSRGRGPSSPLSRKPATDENENKVVPNKQKQKGKTFVAEGRSPLQILKEPNSPRNNTAQMKLKVSTPERQRFGQLDRGALVLSLNKENQ